MNEQPIHILLVEGNPADAALIRNLLREEEDDNAWLAHCLDIEQALELCGGECFDVALVDVRLTDGRGLESLNRLKQAISPAAVIALCRPEDEHLALEALNLGAEDFLMKDQLENGVLSRAIRYSLKRQSLESALHDARMELEEKSEAAHGENARMLREIRIRANNDVPAETQFSKGALDALSAQIGVVDDAGVLLYVNKAWRDFEETAAHAGDWRRAKVGDNYLSNCESGTSHEGKLGPRVAEAMRGLLSAERDVFTLEYSCKCALNKHWFSMRLTRFEDRNAQIRVVLTRENISALKQLEQQVLSTTLRDKMTGLYNRLGFLMMAEQEILMAERKGIGLQLVVVQLNNLHAINDSRGRDAGDRALALMARVARSRFRKSDIVSRVEGRAFAALARESGLRDEETLVRRLHAAMDGLCLEEEPPIGLQASVGLARWSPREPVEIEDLLEQALSAIEQPRDSLV